MIAHLVRDDHVLRQEELHALGLRLLHQTLGQLNVVILHLGTNKIEGVVDTTTNNSSVFHVTKGQRAREKGE